MPQKFYSKCQEADEASISELLADSEDDIRIVGAAPLPRMRHMANNKGDNNDDDILPDTKDDIRPDDDDIRLEDEEEEIIIDIPSEPNGLGTSRSLKITGICKVHVYIFYYYFCLFLEIIFQCDKVNI
jgi:hypothetical protein